jgi:hypothetical protein
MRFACQHRGPGTPSALTKRFVQDSLFRSTTSLVERSPIPARLNLVAALKVRHAWTANRSGTKKPCWHCWSISLSPPLITSAVSIEIDPTAQVARAWGQDRFPTTFLVDGSQIFRHINRGYGQGFRARIERWLREMAAAR